MYLNIQQANVVDPVSSFAGSDGVGAQELTGLQLSGLKLSSYIIAIMALYILVLVVYLVTKSAASPALYLSAEKYISDTTFSRRLQLLQAYQESYQNSRAFEKDMSQMVLLNLLLPILTAILGYIFGTRQDSSDS